MPAATATTDAPPARRAAGPPPARRRSWWFGVWVAVVGLIALVALVFLVLPTRTWLAQRSSLSAAERRLEALQQENEALEQRIGALQDPAEVERLARQQYGMIRPGEKPFSVAPPPAVAQLPPGWPFNVVTAILQARGIVTDR